MGDADAIRDLMAKLMEAVEMSLSSSAAVREALAELVRHGYEPRLYFVANAESTESDEADDEAAEVSVAAPPVVPEFGVVAEDAELRFELTKLDRDFLRSVSIRPECG